MKRRRFQRIIIWTFGIFLLMSLFLISRIKYFFPSYTSKSFTSRACQLFVTLTGQRPEQHELGESKGRTTSSTGDVSAWDAGSLTFQHSNYTADVVIPHFGSEDLSWIPQLPVVLRPIIYTNCATSAIPSSHAIRKLTEAKGHEALTYLTHIVDNYDNLPDMVIFIHPHEIAWHNNDLLSLSMPLTLTRLNPYLIMARGYFNLRCHWDPGCPSYLHPTTPNPSLTPGDDSLRQEEPLVAQAWNSLFPSEPVPTNLAQPCCGQFAVSRAQILAFPKERYQRAKVWLEETELSDYLSGRVFEYLWQYLFAKMEISCPDMRNCYCAAYGVCFGSEENFQSWFEMKWRRREYIKELERWMVSEREINKFQSQGMIDNAALIEKPEVGRIDWLENEIRGLEETMEKSKRKAWEQGRDPMSREAD